MAMPANSGGVDQFEEGKSAGGHASEVEVPEGIIGSAAVRPTPAATINAATRALITYRLLAWRRASFITFRKRVLMTFRADLASIIIGSL
jgi:hypothetical protein